MTRQETVARLELLIADLEQDIASAQTRVLHVALSRRVADARRIIADLLAPAA